MDNEEEQRTTKNSTIWKLEGKRKVMKHNEKIGKTGRTKIKHTLRNVKGNEGGERKRGIGRRKVSKNMEIK